MKRLLHYDIVKQLGEGKNGPSYLAYDTGLQRAVVIKLLSARKGVDESWADAYREQLQPWMLLDDKRIGFLHGCEKVDGHWCVIREYVEGKTLAEIGGESGIEYPRVLKLARDVSEVLGLVHERGLVHGNINSNNILVDKNGKIRLVDYGLAPGTEAIYQGRVAAGDLVYLAPEQLSGDVCTPLCDFYSLGAVLFKLYRGKLPYDLGSDHDLREQILSGQSDVETIPRTSTGELARLLLGKLLAREPGDRFGSADELRITLQGMISLETGQVEELENSRKGFTSRQYLMISILVLLLVILWLVLTSGPR
jgi:serine/threonine-protein kinase